MDATQLLSSMVQAIGAAEAHIRILATVVSCVALLSVVNFVLLLKRK